MLRLRLIGGSAKPSGCLLWPSAAIKAPNNFPDILDQVLDLRAKLGRLGEVMTFCLKFGNQAFLPGEHFLAEADDLAELGDDHTNQ